MGPHWTYREKTWLRRNYLKYTDEEIGRRFGRGKHGVEDMRYSMGLLRPRQHRPAIEASVKSRIKKRSVGLHKRGGNGGWVVQWWDGERWRKMDYGRLWWILNVGELGRYEVVSHKDGNRMNIDPSNFEAVDKREISRQMVKLAHKAWTGAGKHWRRMEKYKQRKGTFDAREQDWL